MKSILLLLLMMSCWGDPNEGLLDPNCGVISYKAEVNNTWITGYRWNDGSCDTVIWYFDPVSNVGDTICKLQEVKP